MTIMDRYNYKSEAIKILEHNKIGISHIAKLPRALVVGTEILSSWTESFLHAFKLLRMCTSKLH